MRRLSLFVLLAIGLAADALAQAPLQREKMRLTKGLNDFVMLDDPTCIPASQAAYLGSDEPVLGLSLEGEHRAYPIRMMHGGVVNEVVGDVAVVVLFDRKSRTGSNVSDFLNRTRGSAVANVA